MCDKGLTPEEAQIIRDLVKAQDVFINNCSFALGVHDGCEHDPNRDTKRITFPR